MSRYKVTVDDDDDSFIGEMIGYIILFTILLPIGIIYLLYKLIVWIYNTRKDYVESHSEDFEKSVEEISILGNTMSDRLISAQEFAQRKEKIILGIRVSKCSNQVGSERLKSIKRLHDKGYITHQEFEDLREKILNKMN